MDVRQEADLEITSCNNFNLIQIVICDMSAVFTISQAPRQSICLHSFNSYRKTQKCEYNYHFSFTIGDRCEAQNFPETVQLESSSLGI